MNTGIWPAAAADCACHRWLVGPVDRAHAWLESTQDHQDQTDTPAGAGVLAVDCRPVHGADELVAIRALVRHVVPWMLEHDPAGVRRNLPTVYALTPDLVGAGPGPRRPWAELADSEVRRLGHGVSDLLHCWGAAAGQPVVVFEHAHRADPSDTVVLAHLLTEVPADLVRLVVCSDTEQVPDVLRQALRAVPRQDV